MLVSWNWLKDYVDLEVDHDSLVDMLTMSGLNHEGTKNLDSDPQIDLEVTSNRPDCLGHIGVAREISILCNQDLRIPQPNTTESSTPIEDLTSVEIKCDELCNRYTARLIRGVKIAPSPQWLQDKLVSIGQTPVNNIVDITNFVLFECGQPLHAFDFGKLKGKKIIVRRANDGEKMQAIDHKEYELDSEMCVIADESNPVAIAGVMGGAATEISDDTTDVLIEVAEFAPLSVRSTSRRLKLHSDSSFRFERRIDPGGLEWASLRCCELIQQIAGGELQQGVIDVGQSSINRASIILRHSQIRRVLGISIPPDEATRILKALGMEIVADGHEKIEAIPPSWRRDLTREIDLVEEVGRLYGFDKIPDDAPVPMAATVTPDSDRIIDRIRTVMTAAGFYEAITPSLVPEYWSNAFSPWSSDEPLVASQPMLGVLDTKFWQKKNVASTEVVRRSLIPSLVEVRRINEYRSNTEAEVFEVARAYLPQGDALPNEQWKLSCISSRDYYSLKGIVESLIGSLNPNHELEVATTDKAFFSQKAASLSLGGEQLGWLGELSEESKKKFGLRKGATVFELDLSVLANGAILIPTQKEISALPSIERDFNFVLNEDVLWSDVKSSVLSAGGDLVEAIEYRETFKNVEKDGADKKRLMLSVTLRSKETTLTKEDAETVSTRIIDQCKQDHGAAILG